MMNRRSLLTRLLAGAASLAAAPVTLPTLAQPPRRIRLQESPLAGFQYHDGETLWPLLHIGAPLCLNREPDNRHDPRAVSVHFANRRIGYLPRIENTTISQLLDRGEQIDAHIVTLANDPNPWRRVGFAMELRV